MKEFSEIFRPDALEAFRRQQFDANPEGMLSTWIVDAVLTLAVLGTLILLGTAARTPIGDAEVMPGVLVPSLERTIVLVDPPGQLPPPGTAIEFVPRAGGVQGFVVEDAEQVNGMSAGLSVHPSSGLEGFGTVRFKRPQESVLRALVPWMSERPRDAR
jgi:hypothetical protein